MAGPAPPGLTPDSGSNIPKAPPVANARALSARPGMPSPRTPNWEDWAEATAGHGREHQDEEGSAHLLVLEGEGALIREPESRRHVGPVRHVRAGGEEHGAGEGGRLRGSRLEKDALRAEARVLCQSWTIRVTSMLHRVALDGGQRVLPNEPTRSGGDRERRLGAQIADDGRRPGGAPGRWAGR